MFHGAGVPAHMYALLCAERLEPSTTKSFLSGKRRLPASSSMLSLHGQDPPQDPPDHSVCSCLRVFIRDLLQ